MDEANTEILQLFKANVNSVLQLADFDHIILDSAIRALERCYEKLKRHHRIDNPYLVPENTLKDLRNIRQHNSLRPQYEEMFNQCIVLLVSHFAYSLEELFRANICDSIQTTNKQSILSEEIRFTVKELQDAGFNMGGQVGEWLIRKRDISFQDMQSIRRTFLDYFDAEISRDSDMNNIIFAQAARHVIAHRAGLTNPRFFAQIKTASPRMVKTEIGEGRIQFTPDEIATIANSMIRFMGTLVAQMPKCS